MKQASGNRHQTCEQERIEEDQNHGYEDCENLEHLIRKRKYRLDCGHLVTLNHNFGNNIAVINGQELRVICTQCLY